MRRRVPNLVKFAAAALLCAGCSSNVGSAAPTTCCLAAASDGGFAVFTAGTIPESLPDALEGVPIRQVRFNLTELDAFKAGLDAVQDDLIAKGVRLVSWGVDPATNSISVGVASDVTAAKAALHDALGDGMPLTVHAEGPVTT
jgi:hypothetical protein